MSFWHHWCHFWDSSSQSQHVPKLSWNISTAFTAPWAFSHPITTCDFGTLAKYIFSKLSLLPDRWSEEMRATDAWKKEWHSDVKVVSCDCLFFCPSRYLCACLFSIPFLFHCTVLLFCTPDEIFHGLTSLGLPHFHTIQVDPLSKSLNEMCKVIL